MKVTTFGNEARERLRAGVNLIANAVKTTLGPRGRNVIYGYHYGYPVCTKDGVTVAKQMECKDPTEQLGMLLIREVAQKTADDAGDGTTTATILAQEIFNEGLKSISTGANPILIKRGIDKAVEEVIQFIDKYTIPVKGPEDTLKVATLSANNDRYIGDLIAEAIKKVGNDGVITMEDNVQTSDTYVETVEGMQLNEGMVSPYFMTDPAKMDATYKNPMILLVDQDIDHINSLVKIIEKVVGTSQRPLVIIANSVRGNALMNLIQNRVKAQLPVLVCKAPYFGEYRTEQLIDIAVLTGARVVGHTSGLSFDSLEMSDLGEAESVNATKSYTTIVNGKGIKSELKARINQITFAIKECESDYPREKLQERLSKLTSGVAVIKVGASTEVEQKEKKYRIEDALMATRAAIEEGVVPGGGVMLLHASRFIKDEGEEEERIGRRILKKALVDPIKQIAFNSGLEGSEIVAKIIQHSEANGLISWGYDFLTNKYGELLDIGVVDPAKVVKATVRNAASVAGMLLTTEVVIAEEDVPEPTRTPKPRTQ